MTEQELFEAFFTVVEKGTGRDVTDFFNEQLNKVKGNKEGVIFLQKSLALYKEHNMCYEHREIFETLKGIVDIVELETGAQSPSSTK